MAQNGIRPQPRWIGMGGEAKQGASAYVSDNTLYVQVTVTDDCPWVRTRHLSRAWTNWAPSSYEGGGQG